MQEEDSVTEQAFLPKVSVIVPIFNGERDLPELMECLRGQTYPEKQVEYLLVDNNSSDRTATILEKEVLTKGITIRHESENKIQSSYAARNKGIRAASSDILAFTDADCRPQEDWLENLVQPFVNPAIGIVVGEILALPGNSILEKYADYCGVMSQQFVLEHPFCPYGQTANLGIRRQALEMVGLFRPYLTTGGDADICWRILQETDFELEFASHGIIRHRHRSNLNSFKSQWQRYGRSNRYLHQLYGVDLMRELNLSESFYRLSRWLLKELPINTVKVGLGKANPIELIKTPIDLFATHARSVGQRESQLPKSAREIEWL